MGTADWGVHRRDDEEARARAPSLRVKKFEPFTTRDPGQPLRPLLPLRSARVGGSAVLEERRKDVIIIFKTAINFLKRNVKGLFEQRVKKVASLLPCVFASHRHRHSAILRACVRECA